VVRHIAERRGAAVVLDDLDGLRRSHVSTIPLGLSASARLLARVLRGLVTIRGAPVTIGRTSRPAYRTSEN